jgi:hypothetical protein
MHTVRRTCSVNKTLRVLQVYDAMLASSQSVVPTRLCAWNSGSQPCDRTRRRHSYTTQQFNQVPMATARSIYEWWFSSKINSDELLEWWKQFMSTRCAFLLTLRHIITNASLVFVSTKKPKARSTLNILLKPGCSQGYFEMWRIRTYLFYTGLVLSKLGDKYLRWTANYLIRSWICFY